MSMADDFDDFDRMAAHFAPHRDERVPDSAYEDDPDLGPNVHRIHRGKGRSSQAAPEMSEKDKDELPDLDFEFWGEVDFSALPRLDFVYSDFYARGYTSVSLAAPKVGKSMLALAEAIDIVTGRGFLTGYQRKPQRVLYYNAEDDLDTLRKRVAALCTFYGIPQEEVRGRLMLVSGVDRSDFVFVTGQEPMANQAIFARLERLIAGHGIDVAIFDPLQDLTTSPETNEVFRLLGQYLRRLATRTQVAIGLIHHTRKVAPGASATIDDMRGGSALRGTARFNRILVGMTEEEATRAAVPNHRFFFRLGDIESNMAPPSADVNRWFEKVSVEIPNGEHIGALRRWEWPDAMEGVTPGDVYKVQAEVRDRHLTGLPCRESVQAKDWVGHVVAEILGLDVSDKVAKSRVQAMVKAWIKSDVLKAETVYSTRDGRDIAVVIAGENNPLERSEVRP